MTKMTERIKETFNKVETVMQATATKGGVPNAVPIAAKKIIDDETILKMKILLSLFAVVLAFGLTTCAQSMAPFKTDEDRGYIVKVGDMAPDFELTLTDGTETSLNELKGKVTMLQFTASWCSVSRKEMPFIETSALEDTNIKDALILLIAHYLHVSLV